MVVQGVKNPMVDLLSLEDKTLDEVRFHEMYDILFAIIGPSFFCFLTPCVDFSHRAMELAQHPQLPIPTRR